MLEKMYPEVLFIQSESNLGFARANNLGAGSARGRVLLFLNPDTEVPESAIGKLYTRFQSLYAVGVAGGRLLNSDGSLQSSCVQPLPTVLNQILDAEAFQRWFPKFGLWTTAAKFRNETKPVEVEALSGACMMVHRGVFEQVGGFSQEYFMYGEDIDLCYRIKQAGWQIFYTPRTKAIHYKGESSKKGPMISLDLYRKFYAPQHKRFIDLCHEFRIKAFHHDDGSNRIFLPTLVDMGIDILNPIQWTCPGMDMVELKREFGRQICFHGAVENQRILLVRESRGRASRGPPLH